MRKKLNCSIIWRKIGICEKRIFSGSKRNFIRYCPTLTFYKARGVSFGNIKKEFNPKINSCCNFIYERVFQRFTLLKSFIKPSTLNWKKSFLVINWRKFIQRLIQFFSPKITKKKKILKMSFSFLNNNVNEQKTPTAYCLAQKIIRHLNRPYRLCINRIIIMLINLISLS